MSVSFDLDQLVEGIENKEPDSPRVKDGEYIKDECKFLPPPKSLAHPRLFFIKNDGTGMELMNEEQVRHMFRTNKHNETPGFIKKVNQVKLENEDAVSHVFISRQKEFNPQNFSVADEFPKLPQSLDLVNQTVSIPQEPNKEMYTYKCVIEYVPMNKHMREEFHTALNKYSDLRAN